MKKRKKRIFVVDGDHTVRYGLRRYLDKAGYETKTLENGFELLLLSMYLTPDLIISDPLSSKLDGVTLLEALRNNEGTKEVPIVFTSAYPADRMGEDAESSGSEFFLAKPYMLESLDDLLHEIFPGYAQEAAKENGPGRLQ